VSMARRDPRHQIRAERLGARWVSL
jgi:hypothetical protein